MKVIRAILLIINIVLAIGLLLSTLAGSVAPSQTVLPSLAAYAYLPLLVANVLMVIVWALGGRWQALISIAAIAIRWSMVGGYVQLIGTTHTPDIKAHPQMISLMTYNVHNFQGYDVHSATDASHATDFLHLVAEQQPDVLCLQEFTNVKSMSLTDSLEVMGYNHYYGTLTASGNRPYGTVVFSRLPIVYVARIDKEKLLVELMKDSCRMRVCCVHMDSYRFDDSDREEIERARHGEVSQTLRPTLSKVKGTILTHEKEWTNQLMPVVTSSSVPMVLAGDLNDIASSWLYQRLNRELDDCFRDKGLGLSITYHGGFPQFRIDMVFHSAGVRTLSYKRIRTDISDHYPVMVTLEPAL